MLTAVERETDLAARRRRATAVAVASLLGTTVVLLVAAVLRNHGTFDFVIDDAYTHVTMARNLALHGSYGVVPGVYESASSSPAWTVLLAALVRPIPAAAALWLPLVLNLAAGVGVVMLVMRSQTILLEPDSRIIRDLLAAIVPLALFLPGLAMVGMEHTLHALLVVALLLMLGRAFRRELSRGELAALASLWALADAVRFETMFLAVGAVLALLLTPIASSAARSSPLQRLFAGLRRCEVWASLLPVAAVTGLLGAVNVAHGREFMPNSVVANSPLSSGHFLSALVPSPARMASLLSGDVMALGLFAVAVVYLGVRRLHGRQSGLWVAWAVALLLHLAYSSTGWFERHQAYLLISGVLLALLSLPELHVDVRRAPRVRVLAPAAAVAVLLGVLPVAKFQMEWRAPEVSHIVYRYDDMLASFLAREYDGRTVMTGDIGMVSYRHRGGLIDPQGLGSYDVLTAIRRGAETPGFIDALARRDHIAVAVLYHGNSAGLVDRRWVQVARWSMFGGGTPEPLSDLDFFAPSADLVAQLRAAMHRFAPTLPADILVTYPAS